MDGTQVGGLDDKLALGQLVCPVTIDGYITICGCTVVYGETIFTGWRKFAGTAPAAIAFVAY